MSIKIRKINYYTNHKELIKKIKRSRYQLYIFKRFGMLMSVREDVKILPRYMENLNLIGKFNKHSRNYESRLIQ